MEAQMIKKRSILIETIGVIVVTFALWCLLGRYRSALLFLPVVYLILDKKFRYRTSEELGFKWKMLLSDVKKSWVWVLVVVLGTPIATLVIAGVFFPDFVNHVVSRVPLDLNILPIAILMIIIGTFFEEVIFRGFIQERLSWFVGTVPAILIASLFFAGSHISEGSLSIVIYDLVWIFIDSIIYGVIFAKTKNLYASWWAHCISDLVGLVLILVFFI